ncbi:hypothetical protein [Nicoliella lavandulae]|uniref:Uncharacterized protein n=1 Tax=Nicoliella lavandulae TaxID=3082954 RepID=A0ABU8SMW2_9LACO
MNYSKNLKVFIKKLKKDADKLPSDPFDLSAYPELNECLDESLNEQFKVRDVVCTGQTPDELISELRSDATTPLEQLILTQIAPILAKASSDYHGHIYYVKDWLIDEVLNNGTELNIYYSYLSNSFISNALEDNVARAVEA